MSLYKRGKIWWYSFTKDGNRYQVSTGSRSKDVAVRAESRKRTELDEGRNHLPIKPKRMTFEVAAKEWIEVKRADWGKSNLAIQRYNLAHLNKHFGKRLLTEITADSIGVYKGLRMDENASHRTINMEISTLRMILKWKRLWSAISDDVKMLEENASIGKQLTIDEETRLLEVCRKSPQPSLYTAVVIFSNAGLRNGELRMARWSQVNFLGRPTFTVGKKAKTKGSAGREVPLNQEALAAFQDWRARWPKAADDDYIFPSEKLVFKGAGAAERGQMSSYAVDRTKPLGSWKTAWRTAKKQAGVECRMHDLRHSFVSKLAETETPGSVIEDLAGHLTAAMRRRYTHISPQAKEQAVARISALFGQTSQVVQ
jgi:integrase